MFTRPKEPFQGQKRVVKVLVLSLYRQVQKTYTSSTALPLWLQGKHSLYESKNSPALR